MGNRSRGSAETYKGIRERVERLRLSNGLTQKQAAQGIGFTEKEEGAYRKKESDNGSKFTYDDLIKIADFYKTDCHYLLTGTSSEHLAVSEALGFQDTTINAIQNLSDDGKETLVKLLEDKRLPALLCWIGDAIQYTYDGLTLPEAQSGTAQSGTAQSVLAQYDKHYALVQKDIAAQFYWEKVSEIIKSIGEDIARREIQEVEAAEHGND